jgi:putative DNA primase/helicase
MAEPEPFTPIAGKGRPKDVGPKPVWKAIVPVPANAPAAPERHYQHGKPSRTETYRDASGRLLGHVCRFDLQDGAKVFLPLTFCANGKGKLEWRWQLWPAPRPLFGLDRLAKKPKAPVVVCEGEKAATAAGALLPDHVAVTSPNGSLAAAKADWSPLAGRQVTLWPDADEPGAKYADELVKLLAPIAASIRRVTPLDGVKEGWDASDAVSEGWDEARAKALIEATVDALKPAGTGKRPRRRAAGDPDVETEGKTPRPRHKDALLAILEGVELWHSPDKIPYATIAVDSHFENHEIRARGFRLWLGYQFFKATGAAASKQATEEALNHAEARGLFEGQEYVPYIRHGQIEDRLYLDIADESWRAIEISADDWQIIDRAPVKFVRSDHMLPLPVPVRPIKAETSIGMQLRDQLGEILPVETEGDLTLIIAWLLMNFHPKGPYPGLGFNGPDGSGKTSAGRVVKRILDPDMAPDRSPPRDELSLCAIARNSWVVTLDNLSYLPSWLSDAMCRLSTGGGISGRSLYTNADEFVYFLKRPQITTGIPRLADRADFTARWIQITMPRITDDKRISEEDFETNVAQRLPLILGLLLTAVSGILANPDEPPRMADFATWTARARPALGWHKDTFTAAYKTNREGSGDAVIQSDIIAQALIDLLEQEHGYWEGTATELIAALPVSQEVRKQKGFPAPNALSERLTRLQNTFVGVGVEIAFTRGPAPQRKRVITLSRREDDRPAP